jgi:hypothetical protein
VRVAGGRGCDAHANGSGVGIGWSGHD